MEIALQEEVDVFIFKHIDDMKDLIKSAFTKLNNNIPIEIDKNILEFYEAQLKERVELSLKREIELFIFYHDDDMTNLILTTLIKLKKEILAS